MPIDIRFIGLEPSPSLEGTIEGRIAHIDQLCPGVTAWRVSVSREARRHRHGDPFSVHVDARLPGLDLGATRSHDEDVHVAAGDALDAIQRELQDAIQIRRGQVRQHAGRRAGHEDGSA